MNSPGCQGAVTNIFSYKTLKHFSFSGLEQFDNLGVLVVFKYRSSCTLHSPIYKMNQGKNNLEHDSYPHAESLQ